MKFSCKENFKVVQSVELANSDKVGRLESPIDTIVNKTLDYLEQGRLVIVVMNKNGDLGPAPLLIDGKVNWGKRVVAEGIVKNKRGIAVDKTKFIGVYMCDTIDDGFIDSLSKEHTVDDTELSKVVVITDIVCNENASTTEKEVIAIDMWGKEVKYFNLMDDVKKD